MTQDELKKRAGQAIADYKHAYSRWLNSSFEMGPYYKAKLDKARELRDYATAALRESDEK